MILIIFLPWIFLNMLRLFEFDWFSTFMFYRVQAFRDFMHSCVCSAFKNLRDKSAAQLIEVRFWSWSVPEEPVFSYWQCSLLACSKGQTNLQCYNNNQLSVQFSQFESVHTHYTMQQSQWNENQQKGEKGGEDAKRIYCPPPPPTTYAQCPQEMRCCKCTHTQE